MDTSKPAHPKLDLLSHIANFRFAEPRDRTSYLSIAVLLVAALAFSWDIYEDIAIEGQGLSHVLVEGGIFLAVLLVLGFEVRRVIDLKRKVSIGQEEIQRLKKHLLEVISDEFHRWQLTDSEQEIALLLIKGYSMQEIARIRSVKEKSVRQQATRIYTKARVSNRNELTSYFIEDLLAPDSAGDMKAP